MIRNSGVRRLSAVGIVLCGLLLTAPWVAAADPVVTGVSASDSLIADGDLPGPLTVTIDFDVAMNTSIPPTLVFAPDVSSTLSLLPGGSWTDSDTYTATYSVADANMDVDSVTVDVTGTSDLAGKPQQDYTPVHEFEIDTLNPLAPAVTGIATDAGSSNADAVTNDSTLILSGTAESQSSVRLYRDGSSIGVPVTANGIGTWTFDYQGTPLADGPHSFTATATDLAGNVSPDSAPLTALVDQQGAPAPEGRTPPDGTRTNDSTPTLSWTAVTTDPGGSGVRDYGYDIGGPTPKNSTTGNTAYTPSSGFPLSDGDYTWKVRTRDVAGNPGSYGSSWSLVIDTGCPTVTILANDVAIYDGDVGVDRFRVMATFSEPMNPSVAAALTLTPNPTTTFTNPSGAWSGGGTVYTWTYGVVDVGVTVADIDVAVSGGQDVAGNVQVANSRADYVDIDTQNPTVAIVANDAAIYDGDVGVDGFRVTATFSEPMNPTAAPALALTPDQTTTFTNLSVEWSGGNTEYTWTYDVADAGVTVPDIDVAVSGGQDAAGNPQVTGSRVDYVDIDTQNPTVTIVANNLAIYDGDVGTNRFTVTAAFLEAMNPTVAPTISFAPAVATTLMNPSGAWSGENTVYTSTYDVVDRGVRVNDIDVAVSGGLDVAGNPQAAWTNTDYVSIDTANPSVSTAVADTLLVVDGDLTQQIMVTFSEAMKTSAVPAIAFSVGTWSPGAAGMWAVGNTVWTRTFTLTDNQETAADVTADVAGAQDAAGNDQQTYTPQPEFSIDTANPSVSTVVADTSPVYDGDLTQQITVTFNEAMRITAAPAIEFGAGAWTAGAAGDWSAGNTMWKRTYTVTDANQTVANVTVDVTGAQDEAGNGQQMYAAQSEFDTDTRNPLATVTTDHTLIVDGSPIYEGSRVLTVTVTYDEAMNTTTQPTISLPGGGTHWGAQTPLGWAGNRVYQATVTHNGTEEPTPPVPALVAFARVLSTSGARDVAGNADVGGDSPTFEMDTRKPELIPGAAAVAIDTDPVYEGDLTQRVTLTFDEAMTTDGSVNPTLTFDHGTWGTNGDGVWNSPTDTVWTEAFTLVDHDEEFYDRTIGVSMVAVTASNARDAAGNSQEPYAAEPEFDMDTVQPEITEFTSVPDGGCHVAGDTIDITVAFSESVFGALTLHLGSGGIVDVLGVDDSESETRTYTIQWGENSCDLDVESAAVDTSGDLVDWAGNYAHWTGGETSLSLPTGHNLADNSAVIVDTTLPIAVTDPDEDEARGGADSDIVEVRLDPQGRYRLMVRHDTPVYIDVLANDIELPCLSHVRVYDFPVLPTHGTIPDESPTNPVRYAPYAGYIGPDEFTYRAIDACGNISVEATGYVEVIPQLAFGDIYVTACAGASVEIDVAATDLFVPPGAPEDAEFTFEIVEGPEHGIVAGDPTGIGTTGPGISTLFIESATVKFIYAPASEFAGRDQFRVRLSDQFGGTRTAAVDIEVQECPWVVESPLVIPRGALLPLIVPLSFASVYETAWDTVTLTGEDGTEHPESLLAAWNESLERPALVVDTGLLAPGVYELVIPLGNGEIVPLRFAVGEKR